MTNPLKAGRLDDFAASMASYIDQAMQLEWKAVKNEDLPTGDAPGAADRQILFAAIAQGVLRFLGDHTVDLITTDVSGDGGVSTHHHEMAFTVATFREP